MEGAGGRHRIGRRAPTPPERVARRAGLGRGDAKHRPCLRPSAWDWPIELRGEERSELETNRRCLLFAGSANFTNAAFLDGGDAANWEASGWTALLVARARAFGLRTRSAGSWIKSSTSPRPSSPPLPRCSLRKLAARSPCVGSSWSPRPACSGALGTGHRPSGLCVQGPGAVA
jgi:hypothetical protein